MSSTEEGGGAVRPSGRAVSTGQTIITTTTTTTNNNPLETIIPILVKDFTRSNSELRNLRSLDEAFEGDQLELDPKAKPLIQRVPSTLDRQEDLKKYFKPKVISIGPLHHDDPTLHDEKLKLKLAAHFVKNIGVDKDTLYNNMKTEIGGLKKCYDPKELEKYSNDNDNEELAWMFFVDGCAILQAVYIRYSQDYGHKPSHSLIKNDLLTFVYSDLLLLENQLPFRVLELLTSSGDGTKFMDSIERFIDDTVVSPAELEHQRNRFRSREWWKPQNPIHLLNLLRERLLFDKEKIRKTMEGLSAHAGSTNIKETRTKWCHSHTIGNIKELKKAGILLKASQTSCLTDIRFNRILFLGKLCLPPITVDDSTMNLIAYEMCPDFKNDFTFTSYMCLLDLLIDEAEDVKDLREAGILYNGLGSDEEVAKLFNKMNTDLVPSRIIYSGVKRKIHNHWKASWIKHAVQGYQTYFRSPWTFLAFVGAITALLLGALQAYYTRHPPE
ncbi:hypothetical protein E1A91_D11G369600v1 [Gossypium mustelinum]|uniref:Uncharacterized protein n=1 Tax=Gossypium mustelinum TaxID=34275 RepID=A0A5D2T0D1_GOSMU|nr:hypothetical protein E1A91_D11G369600v1 [Gossypium mustelinum]